MKEKYHIIPRGDGYHVMGVDQYGCHFPIHKSIVSQCLCTLVFDDITETYYYIRRHLSTDEYEPEPFWVKEVEEADEAPCDGRCLNCDYFDFIAEDCIRGKE